MARRKFSCHCSTESFSSNTWETFALRFTSFAWSFRMCAYARYGHTAEAP